MPLWYPAFFFVIKIFEIVFYIHLMLSLHLKCNKMQIRFTTITKILLCIYLFSICSCLKKAYEGPPDKTNDDPKLNVTNVIMSLANIQQGKAIEADIVLCGIVVMDDKSGNYYKKIVIQDNTAGMEVLLDQSNLYNDFPVGRKVYIKCKGLYLSNYGGSLQLGYTPDLSGTLSGIPAILIANYIVKANYPNQVTPRLLTVAQLSDTGSDKYLNTLIAIQNVEFADSNTGVPYAQMANISSSTSLSVKDCAGGKVTLRTSAYARFQPLPTPQGNGMLTGILTKFKAERQMYIRDTGDIQFYNHRCTQSPRQVLFREDFSSLTDNSEIILAGWNNIAEIGERKYIKSAFQTDVFAKISVYGNVSSTIVKSWLITPLINLYGKSNGRLSFKTKDGFNNGATLKAYVSSNYSGYGDPAAADWTDLNAVISSGSAAGYAANWTLADVPLPFTGAIHIAFKYEGSTVKTTIYELGYIQVSSD